MKIWIAANENGKLNLFVDRPARMFDRWRKEGYWAGSYGALELPASKFPEVTFENSPMEVELKLVNNVQGE